MTKTAAEVDSKVATAEVPVSETARHAPGFDRRAHLVLLALIMFVGLLRGLYWVAMTELWNPTDEAQHYAYVHSLATGRGIPEVGVDKVPVEVLEVAKAAPTWWYGRHPLEMNPDDPEWELIREQYEGAQGPLYYGLMVAPFKLAHPFGVIPAAYALRITSLLIALVSIPLARLLARELFPKRPAIWIAAPALLVLIQGFNANAASINNDALLLPLSIAALIAAARATRTLSTKTSLVTGLLVGLSLVTKMTTILLLPIIGVEVLLLSWGRHSLSRVLRWGLLTGLVAGLALVPWFAFNYARYGNLTASDQVGAITYLAQPRIPASPEGLQIQLRSALTGFWEFLWGSHGEGAEPGKYTLTLQMAMGAALLIGGFGLLRRARKTRSFTASLVALPITFAALFAMLRLLVPSADVDGHLLAAGVVAVGGVGVASALLARNTEGRTLVWLMTALPLGIVILVAAVYLVFGGVGAVVGRHFYSALAPAVILIVAGPIIAFGSRVGLLAVGALAVVALWFEPPVTQKYIDAVYTFGTVDGLAPVVDQSWNDEYVPARQIVVRPPCPVEALGIGFESPAQTVSISNGIQRSTSGLFEQREIWFYRLAKPEPDPFEIMLPAGSKVGSSKVEREPSVAFVEQDGDPMVQLFCSTAQLKASRFEQRYRPHHLERISYGQALAWPSAWAWFGTGLFLVGAFIGARRRAGRPPFEP